MPQINLGRVAFKFKGDYNALTTYAKYDVVFDGESSFVSQINNNLGKTLIDGLNWKYLAKGNNLGLQDLQQDVTDLETDLNGKVPVSRSINLKPLTADINLTKSDIGLGNADNTADTNKPVSSAAQTALNLKTDKTIQIISGNGLIGGGDLSLNRTISIVSGNDGIIANTDNIQLDTIDNLASVSTTKPLSANQGNVLNEKVVQLKTDLNLDEYTLAEALNLLYSKILSLEKLMADGVLGNVQVDSLTTIGVINYKGSPLIIIGSDAPTIAPDFEGQTFINTTSPGTVYTAKGVASVSDWKQTSN